MRAAVLTIRFASELAALSALAATGIGLADGTPGATLAVVLPLTAAAAWGRYVAPASTRRLQDPARATVELLLFTAAVVGLAGTGHPVLAISLSAAVALTAPANRRHEPTTPTAA